MNENKSIIKSNLTSAILTFVFAFLISQIALLFANIILAVISKKFNIPLETVRSSFWAIGVLYLINQGTFFGVFLFMYKTRRPIFSDQLFARPDPVICIICVLSGVASLYLLSPVVNIAEWALSLIPLQSSGLGVEINSIGRLIFSLFFLALLPAVCEEFLFRGAIFNALRTHSRKFAIVMTSLCFAVFHMSGYQFIYPILFGLLLGLIMDKWGNIWYCILTHFFNNAIVLVSNYLSSGSIGAPGTTQIILSVVCTIIFALGIIGFSKIKYKLNMDYTSRETVAQNPIGFWLGFAGMVAIWILIFVTGIV